MTKKYGYAVVNSGEQAIVYDLEGRARIVKGPQRLFLWREKIEILRRFTASQNQYLVVKYRDGKVEHIKGPHSMFRVPTIHDSITVKYAITLDAHEMVVVYRHNGDASERTVDRFLEYGPKQLIPQSNEWLHTFCWHGVDPNNKTRYIPGSNTFTKLKLVPDQFYYNVDEIRTSDNGLIRVKLMIFHEINDIEKMLAATDDPIGDIISCICADVTAFTATKTYTEFVENSCELNDMANYPYLTSMCKGSGIRVSKIVFRGYFAAPKIQANHDDAIGKRTQLQLQFEKEQQNQEMLDRELSSERERIASSSELQKMQLIQTHKISAMKLDNEQELKAKKQKENADRKHEQANDELESRKLEMEQQLNHYKALKDLGVDLNEYILSEAAIPKKVTKIVSETSSKSPNFHYHLNATSSSRDSTA